MYQHRDIQGNPIDLAAGKVVCVGRNYLAHIHELKNEVPKSPLLFIKPNTSLTSAQQISFNTADIHYETELALLIAKPMSHVAIADVWQHVWGWGIALDLTKRELQSKLKAKGHPWELAKAFDNSCPISSFTPLTAALDEFEFSLEWDGKVLQQGDIANMITPIPQLLAYASQHFTLMPGDVILTGTPEGVGQVKHQDSFSLKANGTTLHQVCFAIENNG